LFGFLYFSRKATERPNCIYCHVPNNSEQWHSSSRFIVHTTQHNTTFDWCI
jgi:hypothetical protein